MHGRYSTVKRDFQKPTHPRGEGGGEKKNKISISVTETPESAGLRVSATVNRRPNCIVRAYLYFCRLISTVGPLETKTFGDQSAQMSTG